MTGDVEVDEAYIGGKPYKHHRKPTKNTVKPKQTVLAMVNREDGQVRVRHPQGRVGAAEIGAVLVNNIHRNSRLFTDGSALYKWAKGYFNDHKWVDHSAREYSRREGMDVVTTNTIEGFFSLLKRGVYGTFHSISREHLQLYLSEFEFRYNTRHDDDGERTEAAIRSSVGKRLRYDDHVVRKKAG